MTGFERASIALIYNLYFSLEAYKGKPVVNKSFTVETYDEDGNSLQKRYFFVKEISTRRWTLNLAEGNKHEVYNNKDLSNHRGIIKTEERPNEEIFVEAMNETYVKGKSGVNDFIIKQYSTNDVTIQDGERNNKTFRYKVAQ